jgi:hypothetical protein
MEESERCVEATARSGTSEDRLVASRIIEQPAAYQRWVSDHDRLVRRVSEQGKRVRQMLALRQCAFGLIHRSALFEYLRDQHVVGARRHQLFALFYGHRDYASSVVTEHGIFLRSSSSYLCTRHLADGLMHDGALQASLEYYEELYSEYFRVYCDITLAETPDEKEYATSLLAMQLYLKERVNEVRRSIINLPTNPAGLSQELRLRQPTGDTVKLRIAPTGNGSLAGIGAKNHR